MPSAARVLDPDPRLTPWAAADELLPPRFLTALGLQAPSLSIVAQPIMALRTSDWSHAEVLVRMRDGDRLVPNTEWILPAEAANLIESVDRWVLAAAVAWAAACPHVSVSVNASVSRLDSSYADRLVALCEAQNVKVSQVEVELTETGTPADDDQLVEAAAALRRVGVRVTLDDFGTGVATMEGVTRLPLDAIKLDQTFAPGLVGHRVEHAAVIRATVGLAHDLGIDAVIEGVESEAALVAAFRQGFSHAQGFHVARPMSLARAAELMGG